jgi:thiol:disulfide interchange protein DsbD
VRVRRTVLALLLAIFGVAAAANARAQIKTVGDGRWFAAKAPHLEVALVAPSWFATSAGYGQVWSGIYFELEPGWHVYWVNPGDSGEPPSVKWTLPAGITAEQMLFPIPKRLPLGPLMDYGYEGKVALPIRLTLAKDLASKKVHLTANVNWLVCREVCIPGNALLGFDYIVEPELFDAPKGGVGSWLGSPLQDALMYEVQNRPRNLPARSTALVNVSKGKFSLVLHGVRSDAKAEFYPFDTGVIANAATQKITPLADGVRIDLVRDDTLAQTPAQLHGLVKLSETLAYDVNAPVVVGEVAAAGGGSAASTTAIGAIGLAFLGGILLNLMPCVFPVLFLKGLALVQTAGAGGGQGRAHLRRHGLVYALGILLSFWAIVAVLLVLRATGGHAGWGFQLQSPVFIALLASLIFFLALGLAGQFEIGLSLTSAGSSLVDRAGAGKQSYSGSFFTGVLATVVATPCTAPLMGAAIGFALTQSASVIFAVFTALALGLAAPYLLLSWQPAWVRVLPRPGVWMELLKQFTTVPLFATAIWLAWVYGQLHASSGVDQMALLLTCFLLLAIAGWALGRWPAGWASRIAALVLIVLGLAIPLSQTRTAEQTGPTVQSNATEQNIEQINAAQTVASASNATANAALVWQPYSQQALDAARAAGHPVFLDFTAAWCLSCQFNERAVLRTGDVESALRSHNFVLLKADWTNGDPGITQKLASVGRAGVPTYVLYPADAGSAPDVLPELLTKGLVLAAIERDAK